MRVSSTRNMMKIVKKQIQPIARNYHGARRRRDNYSL